MGDDNGVPYMYHINCDLLNKVRIEKLIGKTIDPKYTHGTVIRDYGKSLTMQAEQNRLIRRMRQTYKRVDTHTVNGIVIMLTDGVRTIRSYLSSFEPIMVYELVCLDSDILGIEFHDKDESRLRGLFSYSTNEKLESFTLPVNLWIDTQTLTEEHGESVEFLNNLVYVTSSRDFNEIRKEVEYQD